MLRKTLLLFTLFLTLSTEVLFTSLITNAAPSSTSHTQQALSKSAAKKYKRRGLKLRIPNVRPSRNLEAGAARGKCSPQQISAVVLPKAQDQEEGTVPVEKTLSARPTFFVYVPETSAKQASFLLKDQEGKIVLEKTLDVKTKSGILSYTLPDNFNGLKANENYLWRLSLLCDPNGIDRSGDANAGGWIALDKPQPTDNLTQKLQSAKAEEDINSLLDIYTKNGYWQDALKTLADLRDANLQDEELAEDWSSLLKSVGLDKLAKEPVTKLTQSSGEFDH